MLSISQRALMILVGCVTFKANDSANRSVGHASWSSVQPNAQYKTYSYWLGGLPVLCVFFALIMTQGLLLLSNQKPLNILLILFILIVMPWLTYFLIFWFKNKLVSAFPVQSNMDNAALLSSFVRHLATQNACIFALVSWLCIWLNLLVKDVPLGWSSTFDISYEQLNYVASIVSAPWGEWFESATLNASWFEQNQFYYLVETKSTDSKQSLFGWRFIMMSVLTYSLLPRLCLWGIGKWRLSKQLNAWIKWQWPLNEQAEPYLINKAASNEKIDLGESIESVDDFDCVISWQADLSQYSTAILGVNDWLQDQRTIHNIANDTRKRKIAILVDVRHAPNAELSDLVGILLDGVGNETISEKDVSLIMCLHESFKLREGLIYSWQDFAQNINIKCFQMEQVV